jgi:hypothetical protein
MGSLGRTTRVLLRSWRETEEGRARTKLLDRKCHVVALGQLAECRVVSRRSRASCCYCEVRVGEWAMCCSHAFAPLRGSCLPPCGCDRCLVPVSTHGSANERNCAPASTIRLTMTNRSKVERARRSIRVTVTTWPGAIPLRSFSKLASGRRARRSISASLSTSCLLS